MAPVEPSAAFKMLDKYQDMQISACGSRHHRCNNTPPSIDAGP